jgi:hypothetical protein
VRLDIKSNAWGDYDDDGAFEGAKMNRGIFGS